MGESEQMKEQKLIQEMQKSGINYAKGCDDANFARESGSLKHLEAIYRVAMWRYRYFLSGVR